MILYTPLCQTEVFPISEDEFSKHQFVSYQSKTFYVEEIDQGSYELLQLLSTDPQDFLNTNYAPGTILSRMNEQ